MEDSQPAGRRWIVDAMNVIGTRPDGWWKNRRAAMVGLVDQLERWAAAHGHDVRVVFERPISPPINSTVIQIGHAPKAAANSADDERPGIATGVRGDDGARRDPSGLPLAGACAILKEINASGGNAT